MKRYIKFCILNMVISICVLNTYTLVFGQTNTNTTKVDFDVHVIENKQNMQESLNNIKSETYVEQLTASNDFITLTEAQLPSKYSSVDKGYISAVKDQGQFGTCWAFGTLAAIEANLIKNNKADRSIDLSEAQLSYFAYHQPVLPSSNAHRDLAVIKDGSHYLWVGGHYFLSSVTFAKGIGIAKEATMPYNNLTSYSTYNDSLALESDYVVKNNYFINMGDKVAIKNALMKYGSVAAACYMNEFYMNDSTGAYHQDAEWSTNHAVVIVGWDDNYSVNNFYKKPSKNGAWLVKNSYGSGWGNNGYFWISYEEISIPYSLGAVFEADVNDGDYLHRYQYDGSSIYAYIEDVPAYANIYTAQNLEQISEVGIFTKDNNVKYQLEIYKNVTNTPVDGSLVHTQSGTIDLQGYHTIEIDKVVNVSKGSKFSVVIRTSDEYGNPVDMMLDMTSDFDCTFNYNSVTNQKESFVYDNWYRAWLDMATGDNDTRGYNCRIKVMTKKCDFDFDIDDRNNYNVNKTATIKSNVDVAGAEYKYVIYNKSRNEKVTIDYSSATSYAWVPSKTGNYEITVSMKDKNKVLSDTVKEYTLTKNVTISNNISIILDVKTNYDYNNYKLVFTPTVTNYEGDKTYTYIVKNESGIVVFEKNGVVASTYEWVPTQGGTYTVYCTVNDNYSSITTYKKYVVPTLKNFSMNTSVAWTNSMLQLTVKAKSESGAGVTQYCYTVKDKAGKVVYTRGYTIQDSYACQITQAGTYNVECMVKDSLGIFKKLTQTVVINGLSNINTTIVNKKVSNKPVITISASASNGYGTRQYYYRIKKSNGTVVATRNYAVSPTYEWKPTSGGTYYIEAYIKDALGSTVNKTITYNIASMSMSSMSIGKKNVSKGLRVRIEPKVANYMGDVTYYYQVKDSGGKILATKNYSTATYYDWYPKSAGTYTVICNAKDSCGNVVTKQASYSVTKSSVKISKVSYTKKKSGKKYKITIKPSASGGYGTKSYEYQILNSKGKVQTKKAYTTSTKVTLTVSKKGTYYIRVYAKDKWGTKTSKKIKVKI